MRMTYLGDGVYVKLDNQRGFVLTTENGIKATNTIILEPKVMESLITYVKDVNGVQTL